MAYDANITLQALTTATTANVTGSVLDTKTGTPRAGVIPKARWIYSGASAATVGAVWTPVIQRSKDNSTWVDYITGDTITATTAAQSGVFFLPLVTDENHEYLRTVLKVSPTTGSPTFAFQVDFGISQP